MNENGLLVVSYLSFSWAEGAGFIHGAAGDARNEGASPLSARIAFARPTTRKIREYLQGVLKYCISQRSSAG